MTKVSDLEERINRLNESQGSSLWVQVFAELTPQERTDMRGFLLAMKHANWADTFDFETQLKFVLSGLVSEAEHDAMLKGWRRYRDLTRESVGSESIRKLLDLLESKPENTRGIYDKIVGELSPEEQSALAHAIKDAEKAGIDPDLDTWLATRPQHQQQVVRKVAARFKELEKEATQPQDSE